MRFCGTYTASSNKAVADGAVSFYLDHIVSVRMARFTYGTEIITPYLPSDPEHIQRAHTKFTDMSGELMVPNAFDTILAKVFEYKFSKFGQNSMSPRERNYPERRSSDVAITVKLLLHRLSTQTRNQSFATEVVIPAPAGWIRNAVCFSPISRTEAYQITANFSTLCIVSADMSRVIKTEQIGPSGHPYYVQHFSVILLFGLTELEAQISWMENVRPWSSFP